MRRMTVCVDLDRTLARFDRWEGIDNIGDLLPGAKEFMDELYKYAEIIIFTCRCCEDDFIVDLARSKNAVEKWLITNQIPYDEIYDGQGKPIADLYIDDKAFEIGPHATKDEFAMAMETIKDRFGL